MPYEYGYELSSCDNCGSSLHQYGESCSNCDGVYRPPDPTETTRQVEVGRLFAERQREAALKREEVKKYNESFSLFSSELERHAKRIDHDVREKLLNLTPDAEKTVQKKYKEINNWRHYKFTQLQKQKVLSLLRHLHVFTLMHYDDGRELAVSLLRETTESELQRLTGWKPHYTRPTSEKKTIPSFRAHEKPQSSLVKHEAVRPQNSLLTYQLTKKTEQPIPKPVKQRETPKKEQTLYLCIEGEQHIVEKAVANARQWQLAPRYVSFSRSNPNVVWKARIEADTVTSGLFQRLIAAGWNL